MALAPAVAGAAAGQVATASAGGDAVVWQPQIGSYDRLVLTVSGPGGSVTQSFGQGQTPSYPLFDAAGNHAADGAYKWELRVVPRIDAATRQALAHDRAVGSTTTADRLRAQGVLPAVSVQNGYFRILDGAVVMPGDFQEAGASASAGMTAGSAGAMTPLPADVVLTNADGVIRNSLCVGLDCPDSPSFSDSSILMMENNNRIKFDDTSVSPFPNNDWELEANSNLSGGPNQFAVNDCANSSQGGCATDPLFVIEAGARSNALFVESDGDIGVGTSNPVLDLHIVTGNTPAIRLDQDGSSGFTPQVWDIAGNETTFFIRDATHASALPFRIQPGAPSNSVFVASDGDVGIGTASPGTLSDGSEASLHILRSDGDASMFIQETNATNAQRLMLELANNGDSFFRQRNTATGQFVDINLVGDEFRINFGTGGAGPELRLTNTGNLIITGAYTPDYVFEPDYKLMPIAELASYVDRERHLPNVPNAAEIKKNGIVVNNFPMQLLEKIEELTLYTIDQHQQIESQQQSISTLSEQNAQLQARLAALEKAVGGSVATTQQ